MNIVKVSQEEESDQKESALPTLDSVESLISKARSTNFNSSKNKEIVLFLCSELERIFEYKILKDIEKYINSINYYLLEDAGEHDKAMALKIKFYRSGNRYPCLPMVNLLSFLIPQI